MSFQTIQFDKVADLYDSYVNVDFDIPFWIQEAKGVNGKVLELTSGTGRVSLPLLKAGIDLTCIDYSKEMLAILRQKIGSAGLSCRAIVMDLTALSLRELYDLIFIPFTSFSEIVDHSMHKLALQRIRSHLAPSGQFICTLHNPMVRLAGIDGKPGTLGRFKISSGKYLIVRHQLSYDVATQLVHGFQVYEIYDERDTLIERRSLEVNFYMFRRREFEDLARSTGFEVLNFYGDYDYREFHREESPFMIWRLGATRY